MTEISPGPKGGLASVPLPIWIAVGIFALLALSQLGSRQSERAQFSVAGEGGGVEIAVGDASLGPLIEVVNYDESGKAANTMKVPNVPAAEIAAAFDANEVAAFQRYGGKLVAVTGEVESISLDFADDPVVSFDPGRDFSNFDANFDKERGAATAELRKGQMATVVCADIREFVGSPSLNDCWLLPKAETGDDPKPVK